MANLISSSAVRALRNGLVKTSRNQTTFRTINTSLQLKQASSNASVCSKSNVTEKKLKNWVSWGFDENDKFMDRVDTHVTFFVTISLCLVGGSFILSYLPDPGMQEWAQREAYLQLRTKEKLGLPPIDINYIDPAKIKLPTDEELGDTEIII
ncbi:NADH dehydrogenase [ubiquinone] 1 beta subcomplex subunit 11, mitochondrial [Aphidius gifuensis]|uniref:NADH dehydrogenase [ubiquinone] 1 beta subcomplex subunit 11, mitochondrial n=1 Tax=Aphidius gifuensis TaxID=684658 RepID=UPI001CDCA1F6|nr:NADH dehydrogenase [ubiquinone] 1 beta subcomplex subunit 11, mitochondrial [Aphidius gifuensis]